MSIPYYNDFHFISAGELPNCRARIDRSFGPTIALNLLWRGSIHFVVEGAPRTQLDGPMAFWTWDGPRFCYGNIPGAKWHQLWVHGGGPRAERMVQGGLVPRSSGPWSVPREPSAFLERFRRLVDLVASGRSNDHAERVQILEQLFREAALGTEGHSPESTSPRRRVEALAGRIMADPLRAYDFGKEARSSGISYHHLRRLFKDFIGRAPQAYLLDCRIRWAAGRLTGGAESVKAVAFASGFAAPGSFARQFRRRTGMPPSSLQTRPEDT